MTILQTVTNLVVVDTLSVTALELVHFGTGEVIAELRRLVTVVTAVVNVITKIVGADTEMVGTLMLVCRTILAPGISWLTVHLIREVGTVSVPVTPELFLNAVAGLALELSIRALMVLTLILVRSISTVVIMVALPSCRDALVIVTFEL